MSCDQVVEHNVQNNALGPKKKRLAETKNQAVQGNFLEL